MHIHSLKLQNYKGIKDLGEIVFNSGINVFCGKNNSGKTSILDFLNDLNSEFLIFTNGYASSNHKIYNKKYKNAQEDKVNFEIAYYFDESCSSLFEQINNGIVEIIKSVQNANFNNRDSYIAFLQYYNVMANNPFILKYTGFFSNDFNQNDSIRCNLNNIHLQSPHNNYLIKINKQEHSLSFGERTIEPIIMLINEHFTRFFEPGHIDKYIQNNIYNLKAHRICNQDELVSLNTSDKIASDFSNYKQTLFTLKLNNENVFQEIQAEVKEIFNEIDKIEFITRGSPAKGNVVIKPLNNDYKVSINDVGTGTEQIIGLITAVVTAEKNSIFLIDEPHVFLHPEAERKLMSFLKKHTEHQYFLATHSPIMINSVGLNTVSLLMKNENNDIKIRKIGNKDKYEVESLIEELEFKASDFFFNDAVIWVEGQTEELIFEDIIEKLCPNIKLNYLVKRVHATGDFDKKLVEITNRAYENIKEIYNRFNIPFIFIFDRDNLKSLEIKKLEAVIGSNKLLILKKRQIENYFLSPNLICEVIEEIKEDLFTNPDIKQENFPVINNDLIQKEINNILLNAEDRDIFPEGKPESGQELNLCKGAEVLNRLFFKFLNQSKYEKTMYVKTFVGKILKENSEAFSEIGDFINKNFKSL